MSTVETCQKSVFPVSDSQFATLGMIKVATKAIRSLGPIATLEFEDSSRKTILSAPHHSAFWRAHPELFFKDLDNPQTGVSAARAVLGTNLLTTADGAFWKSERSRTTKTIAAARPLFDRGLENATDALETAMLTQPDVPLLDHCVRWSRHISCDAIFGTRVLEEDADRLVQSLNNAFLSGMTEQAMNAAKANAANLLTRAKAEHGPDCLIAEIMAQEQNIESRLESDVLGLIAASLHINALSLFWTLQQVSTQPDVQDRLQMEARPLGRTERRLSNAPFAFATAQEAQRLRPAMAFIERQICADFSLDGVTLGKGDTVLFSPWFAHRDPAVWENPETFDPDRFSAPANITAGSYFPFGLGPRMCPGSTTVNRHVAYALSRMCGNISLSPNPETRPGDLSPLFKINLEPRGPVFVQSTKKDTKL